jgi:hypothetical protein
MWICPKDELNAEYADSFLLDKKYVAHDDYQLILGRTDRGGARVLRACLGFGESSATWHSRPARFRPHEWRQVAFTYDGAGTGAFYLDGVPWGSKRMAGCGSITPGRHPLSIGDRIGSYYHGFPGYIDQVRICRGVRGFEFVRIQWVSDRTCYERMEPDVSLAFRVTNLRSTPLAGAELVFAMDGNSVSTTPLDELAAGATVEIECPLDTRLRPDTYPLLARITASGPPAYQTARSFSVRVAPRHPRRFPVVMWGVYGGVTQEIDRLQQIGFSHVLGLSADYAKIRKAGEVTEPAEAEKVAETRQMLDEALARGLRVSATLSPGAAMRGETDLQRIDRQGKAYAHRPDICGLCAELGPFCRHVGASVARTYGHFPAFDSALLHTEVRGHARPCFHDHDKAAFRQHAGIDIPAEVSGSRGVDYRKLDDFPATRVIPDDHPIYTYYRWYWKTGDGWNGLNTALHDGLKSTGRDGLWTWHDPAVRVASVYGSGGATDVLSQWTYSYPDPIRIAVATDELLAMAAGTQPPQRVMKMTQIIWYRSQTAPETKEDSATRYTARWEREQPHAPFITIPPMHLREAFWTKISRPIEGIMYHGWQSLVPCDAPSAYRYTHPQTQHELARLIREIIEPLGPTLLAIPGVPGDVAFLESFASEMFARRGTYGWCGGWAGDAYHVLLYTHLQPEIIFDETIVGRGLKDFRVLVLTDCDVLTESVVGKIQQFQKAGGLIVGDERLCPAIQPDVELKSYARTGRAHEDKQKLLALAAQLTTQLDQRYTRYVDTSQPEVIPYYRRFGPTDYVFLVNDRREFGRYVGHHGIVMENGLPCRASVSVRRSEGVVYDLVEHRRVDAQQKDEQLVFEVALAPCGGGMYMISPQAIDKVVIAAPQQVDRPGRFRCRITVADAKGEPLSAVVPLEVNIWDAEGRAAEYSGHYAAASGTLEVKLDIAPNDPAGVWQIDVRELASGRKSSHALRVGTVPDASGRDLPSNVAQPVQPKG